jgi:hypothetical protein
VGRIGRNDFSGKATRWTRGNQDLKNKEGKKKEKEKKKAAVTAALQIKVAPSKRAA